MDIARPVRPLAPGRALAVFAAVCIAAAGGLIAIAFWPSDVGDTTDMSAAAATIAETPTTVPPAASADEEAAQRVTPTTPPTDPTTPTTTIELSPLADLLGASGSAIPPTVEPRVRPATLRIGDIDVTSPVRSVGLEDDGELEVPDETEIGWYQYGASPGRPGATVLAAHVTWNQTTGPFFRLRELEPGALVDVTLEDGTTRTYQVTERAVYDKDSLPRNRIWRNTGDEQLVLITCGGSFNPDINRYRQNVVVYAVPVSPDSAPQRPTS